MMPTPHKITDVALRNDLSPTAEDITSLTNNM